MAALYLGAMLADRAFAPVFRLPPRLGSRRVFVATWLVIGSAAVAQRCLDRALAGDRNDLLAVGFDLWLIALWALATPTIMRSARRFPLRPGALLRHGIIHLGAAAVFILATNAVIRLPMLALPAGGGAGLAVRSLGMGLVRFGPTALVVYALIVALGQLALREAPPSAPDTPALKDAANDGPPARVYPERITVREWNRVHLVRAAEVEWVESDDNYVIVHVAGRTYKGRGRIRDLETALDPCAFVRIHRSAIVAVDSVREVQPLVKGDLAVILRDGKVLRVARTRRAALEARLGTTI